jgi:hypothetical protein
MIQVGNIGQGQLLTLQNAIQTLQNDLQTFQNTTPKLLRKGTFFIGDVSSTDITITIPINPPLPPATNYMVVGTLGSVGGDFNEDNDVLWMVRFKNPNTFLLVLREFASVVQQLYFDYLLIELI